MYHIRFYRNAKGEEPIKEYLTQLQGEIETNKNSRIKISKIYQYIQALEEYGTRVGFPYVKHIDGDIWELRPLQDRIFFFYYKDNTFILLHYFQKKTQKTPPREIEQAKRNLNDYLERN